MATETNQQPSNGNGEKYVRMAPAQPSQAKKKPSRHRKLVVLPQTQNNDAQLRPSVQEAGATCLEVLPEKELTGDFVRNLTPTSRHILREFGFVPRDLVYRALETFKGPGVTERVQLMRYEEYEKQRRYCVGKSVKARRRVLLQDASGVDKMELFDVSRTLLSQPKTHRETSQRSLSAESTTARAARALAGRNAYIAKQQKQFKQRQENEIKELSQTEVPVPTLYYYFPRRARYC